VRTALGTIPADAEEYVDTFAFERIEGYRGFSRAARGPEHGATLRVDVIDELAGKSHGFVAAAWVQSRISVAYAQHLTYSVAVMQLEEYGSKHVVEAGTQAAARQDSRASPRRIEEDTLSRSGPFEINARF
jgi:hypothetical protein